MSQNQKRHTASSINDDALDELYANANKAWRRGDDWKAKATQAEGERDGAYRERARLVAYLAALHPSHIGHSDPSAPEWAVVIVETPAGQMSWHVSPRDLDLFEHVRPTNRICRGWDGHSTDEKYERLRDLTAATELLPLRTDKRQEPRSS